jgi:hypothetical protein
LKFPLSGALKIIYSHATIVWLTRVMSKSFSSFFNDLISMPTQDITNK